jgi:hypothetical protein
MAGEIALLECPERQLDIVGVVFNEQNRVAARHEWPPWRAAGMVK